MADVTPIKKDVVKADKMKLGLLTNTAFINGLNAISECDLPIKTSYWVGKSLDKITSHTKHFDESRIKCLKKYVELDEAGNMVLLDDKKSVKFKSPADALAFEAELKTLQDEEVEVLKIHFDALVVPKEAGDKKIQMIKPWVFASLGEFIYE